jgi:predicted Zn-dependent protease
MAFDHLEGCKRFLASSLALVSTFGCAAFSQLNIVSEEQELQMGAQFADELSKELKFIRDPSVVAYIDSLGQAIARVSQRNYIPYTFQVVDTDEVNAFAVPGGYLYVNRGLIEAAESESELAGVLGHEIGHVVGRHSARQMSQQYGLQVLAGLALGQNPNALAQMTANILAVGTITRYSREMESEADSYGVQELYAAGLDPNGLATFFDKLEEMRKGKGGGALEKFFATHPDPGLRASTVREQVAKLPPRNLRKDSPRFHEIQGRVKKAKG